MKNTLARRKFLSSLALTPIISSGSFSFLDQQKKPNRLKTSLNAYSFNDALKKGEMSLDDLIEFCAGTGFDAVDITGYYFNGYPVVPSEESIFHVKRVAHRLGLEISGTGVRNDFSLSDKTKRPAEVQLVKNWVEVAAKLGAPVLRIFAGNNKPTDPSKPQILEWMMEDIRLCVEHAGQYGVIIGLQNHNDFLQTADEVNRVIEAVNSEWFGLILDTGSYRVFDAYQEIEKSIKHAVNWQVKEKIFLNGVEVDTDIKRIVKIIRASNYNGYLPIETLSPGDPKIKVPLMFQKLLNELNA